MSKRNVTSQERRLRFEQFEQRLVMSAQAVASLLPELDVASPAITQQSVSLESPVKQASDIAAQYGLDGKGQTVAVIDSGIAWDHYALGNGFGAGNKVVGGWDFAENDANPYDDGPAGYHGSHVAGIIGSTDSQYTGVAKGVDLVGLRVFGDNGEGDLKWVEQALQWVHENKDAFANPITTVNLSLGTNWNADSMPEWASLENEFAQLEADGLFISVAAGNSFLTFGQAGLSYPAVSEHVVPVSSHDADGNMSRFSQRDDGVLVAPGESIRSSVPDHLFGGTSGNQFLGSTGTSMAAPYVAGASAVLRQANQFMGVENITQDLLYQQFRETADKVFDSVTGQYFYNINLDAALASVIQDWHSDTRESATNAGVVQGGETIEGRIGKLTDVDSFRFTSSHTGKVTLNFEVTDNLIPLVDVAGSNATINGHEITIEVIAGQTYEFAVATASGTGHYKIYFVAETVSAGSEQGPQTGTGETINWGNIISKQFVNQTINGQQNYQLTAMRDGFLTVEAFVDSGDSLRLEIYDSQNRLVGSTSAVEGQLRLDINAKTGENFFVKAIGQSDSADFRVSNLVSLTSGKLSVHGTHLADNITVSTDDGFNVNVNGVQYRFADSAINQVTVIGHQGDDSIDLKLGAEDDRVNTRIDGVSAANHRFRVDAFEFAAITVDGGRGKDLVTMIGSNGNDSLIARKKSGRFTTSLTGSNFTANASGFETVHVVNTNGSNSATLNGTVGNDLFVSRGERSWLKTGGGITVMVDGYDSISVNGGGGNDYSNLYDSAGNDRFVLTANGATLNTDSYTIQVNEISRNNAFSTRGTDSVAMHGTTGAETFNHANGVSILNGSSFNSYATGFANVDVVGNGGSDFAQIIDTAGDDRFIGNAGDTEMRSNGLSVGTTGFKQVNLIARNGGHDTASLTGTNREDVVLADANSARLKMSNGQTTRVVGMEETTIDMGDGLDLAFIMGSVGDDAFEASYSQIELESTLQLLRVTNVEHTHFDGNGGNDDVRVKDVGELDLLKSMGDEAVAYLQDHTVNIKDFTNLEATTVDGAIAEYNLDKVDFQYLLRGDWLKKL